MANCKESAGKYHTWLHKLIKDEIRVRDKRHYDDIDSGGGGVVVAVAAAVVVVMMMMMRLLYQRQRLPMFASGMISCRLQFPAKLFVNTAKYLPFLQTR